MIYKHLEKNQSRAIQKLAIGFILIIVGVIAVTLISSQSISRVTAQSNVLIQQQIPELRKITLLESQISTLTNNIFEYYATQDRQYFLNNLSVKDGISQGIQEIEEIKDHPEIASSLIENLSSFNQQANALDQEMSTDGRNWDKIRTHLYTAQKASKSMELTLGNIGKDIKNSVEAQSMATQHEVKQLNLVQLGFGAAVLFASIFIAFNLYSRFKDQAELFKRAYFNSVSKLPNRKYFEKHYAELMQEYPNTEHSYLLIGLDRFNLVTGSMGFIVGDKLIKSVSSWLDRSLKKLSNDFELYHFSETAWLVMLPNTSEVREINKIANSLLKLTTTPMEIGDRELSVNCSIGMCIGEEGSSNIEDILRNLDAALREARKSGGNCMRQYGKQMSLEAQNWLDTENALRYSVEKRELELFFQPKIDAKTRKVCGAEALLRWRQGDKLVSPAVFIPVAESSRLIIKIGHWVLTQACKQWMYWQSQGLPSLPVAVNVSALQFQDPTFADQVKAVIQETGIPPHMLELEITEEAAAFDPQRVVEIMQTLKTIGVSLAIDDFGTGYSSLSHLKRFPVDVLKIDRSFVSDIESETSTEASIVKLILRLAQQLNVKVVAEGVETEMQYQQLKHWECEILQGFLFSKPLPAEEYAQLLKLESKPQLISSNGI